jgi:hypothetical protein
VHEPHHHASSHGKRRPPPALHRPQCDLCRRTEINPTGLDSNGPDDESITLALSDRGYCHEQLLALTPRGGVRKWSTVPISLSYTTPRGERAASERHTKSRRLRLPLPSHYPSIMLQTYRTRYRDEKRCELDEGFSGGDEAHAAVSPRPPTSLSRIVPRTEGNTNDATFRPFSIVRGAFSVAPVPNPNRFRFALAPRTCLAWIRVRVRVPNPNPNPNPMGTLTLTLTLTQVRGRRAREHGRIHTQRRVQCRLRHE